MKTKLFIVFTLVCCFANAQTPNWLWATSSGGMNNDHVKSITTDLAGNVYAVGSFSSDSLRFGDVTLVNSDPGTYDMFIVKYDGSGTVIWARSFGGGDNDYATAVATDATTTDKDGDVYLGGCFRSDTIAFDTVLLTNSGPPHSDLCFVKIDPSGNVLWANSSGNSPGNDSICSVCTDKSGNVFYAGCYTSDSITLGGTTLHNAGAPYFDFYIVKYSATGNMVWAKGVGSELNDAAKSISADVEGNLYAGGYFFSSVLDFGGKTVVNYSPGTADLFLAKYNPAGNVLWVRSAGGEDSEYGFSVAADAQGNAYLGGSFRSYSVTFGTITLKNTGPPNSDICLVKYDSAGNVLWVNTSQNSPSSDAIYSICTDNVDNVYISGPYQSEFITFGTTTLENVSPPYLDFYLVKYNSEGAVLWTQGLGSWNDEAANSICADANRNLFAGGYFSSSTLDFGGTSLVNSSPGKADLFVAEISFTTGMAEEAADQNMILYPNPVYDNATMQFKTALEDAELYIYDLYGQKIRRVNGINGNKVIINRGNLLSGMYFITVNQDGREIANQKLMVADR